jgi:hypothetical protein
MTIMMDLVGEVHGKSLLLGGWHECWWEPLRVKHYSEKTEVIIALLPIPPTGWYNVVNVSHSASAILVLILKPHSVWFPSPTPY